MGLEMGAFGRVIVACCLVVQLAACASTSALESQSKQRDPRLARLYFLREKGLIGAMGGRVIAADVKVDGKPVGTLALGSYIFVDRPPGVHKLSVGNKVSMAFEVEVQVEAGQSYYFNIGPMTKPGVLQDAMDHALAGGHGEPMQAQSPLSAALSGVMFYRLEAAAGAAEIRSLRAQ